MEFSKIRYKESEGVELVTKIKAEGGVTETRDFTCATPPRAELPAALQAFRPFVISLLPLRDEANDDLVITTLSIDEERQSGRMGLIVTALLPIEKANDRPLVLNTPRMREWQDDGDEQPAGTFGEDVTKLIENAQAAARAYYRGERGQAELFQPEETTAEAAAPAAEPEKPKRRRKKEQVIDGYPVVNPGATKPYSSAYVADLLTRAGRVTAIEGVQMMTSSELEAAIAWAEKTLAEGGDGEQPDATAAESTWDEPAPKLGKEGLVAVHAAVEG